MATTMMTIKKEQCHMTEKILDLALKIIYLLTGEDYTVVKKTSGEYGTSGEHCHVSDGSRGTWEHIINPSTVYLSPLCDQNSNMIVDVSKKIIEHLTGEVPIRCQDVTVYFSMEEWEYLEGHKDLYKDVMMEDYQTITSPDGCYVRNTSEGDLILSNLSDYNEGKCDIVKFSPEMNQINPTKPLRTSCVEPSMDPSNPEEPSDPSRHMTSDIHLSCHSADPSTDLTVLLESSLNYEGDQTEEGSLSCLDCGLYFNMKSELLQHLKTHNHTTFSCSECGKVFPEKRKLVKHQKRHKSKKSFSCLECGKRFSTKEYIVIHQRIHTGERPYSCPVCGKSFFDKRTLYRHEKIHSKHSFICSVCGKGFSDKRNFLSHQRIHTGERPFSCPECDKSYTKKGDLNRHQKTHTSERPYSCLECRKRFAEKGQFFIHQKSHMIKRPHICSECGKGFLQRTDLIVHLRSHTGERPYPCTECGKCFITRGHLNKHRRTHTRRNS